MSIFIAAWEIAQPQISKVITEATYYEFRNSKLIMLNLTSKSWYPCWENWRMSVWLLAIGWRTSTKPMYWPW